MRGYGRVEMHPLNLKILFRSVERGELERNVVLNNGAYHSARRKEIGVKRNYLRWYSVRKGHLRTDGLVTPFHFRFQLLHVPCIPIHNGGHRR